MSLTARERLLVALDVDTADEAVALADKLRDHVGGFKIGSRLFTVAGPSIVRQVGTSFLDLKFHDIPNTVAGAVKAACTLNVKMCNLHASGGGVMMKAGRGAADEYFNAVGNRPLLLGVTMLTSMNDGTMKEVGFKERPIGEQVLRLARLAHSSGMDGIVCSAHEIELVREYIRDSGFLLVVPGIRGGKDDKGDQSRTMSATDAVRLGADYLVIGRPIISKTDPVAAADAIVEEITAALAART